MLGTVHLYSKYIKYNNQLEKRMKKKMYQQIEPM